MNAKLNAMTATQVFEVIAGLMSDDRAESDAVLDVAMNVLMAKVGDEEFCRLMEQFQ